MSNVKATVTCGEALTVAQVADLHQQLKQAMEQAGSVEIQADKVEKVDTAGLQVLIAASREIEKSGGSLSWKNPSEAVVQSAQTLGLTPFLSIN